MNDQQDELRKLQAIATAREILNTEYNKQRAEEYNAWITNSQNAWQGNNITIPYPPFVANPAFVPFQSKIPFPSESDVVAKALEIYMKSSPQPVPEPAVPEPSAGVAPNPEVAQPAIDSPPITMFADISPVVPQPAVVEEPQTVETNAEPDVQKVQDDPYIAGIKEIYKNTNVPAEETTSTSVLPEVDLTPLPMPAEELSKVTKESGRILPNVLKKIEELKSSWAKKPNSNGEI